MTFVLLGVNHKTAPVEVRERLSIPEAMTSQFAQAYAAVPGIRGATVLSTCNRVEVTLSCDSEELIDNAVRLLIERTGVSRQELEQHLYLLRNEDVVRHLIRVTAGLDSMIVGEPQIAGQVRQSFTEALEASTLDSSLQRLYEHVLRAAKRIRSETGIGEHAVSVPFAAVELARKIFGDLNGLQILLVGAGKMGELTAQHLNGFGLKKVFVANRAFARAVELATRFSGEAIDFTSLDQRLVECDIVIASTAAPHFVLGAEAVRNAIAQRGRRDLFLIDLSVPRNLDPEIAKVSGAYLYNIDDLREVVDFNREKREKKAIAAEDIVASEVDSFVRRVAASDAIPTILELQGRLDEIRRVELEKCLRRLGPVSADQREAIEALTTGIINKVLHYPIIRLKESAAAPAESADDRETVRETILKIFGLR